MIRIGFDNCPGLGVGPDVQGVLSAQYLMPRRPESDTAASVGDALGSGKPMGPITLTPPMPSITPPPPQTVSGQDTGIGCRINRWVSDNPGLAVLTLLGVFLVAGGKK